MAGQPGSPEFEERFVQWYVWATQNVAHDARLCRAAAWAAVTGTGTEEERVDAARRAALGPDVDELAEAPPPELRARAEAAAEAAQPRRHGLGRTFGIIAGVIALVLLILGGVCFAIAQIGSSVPPPPK